MLQTLYQNLPVWLQNVAISAYGYTWNRRRFGGIFESSLREFKDREAFSPGQWRAWQTSRLRVLLRATAENVPYYRELFKQHGMSSGAIDAFELEHLPQIPLLEKDTLRRLGDTGLMSARPGRGGQFFGSSGSTGTPTRIFFSSDMHRHWSAAFEARCRHWAGVNRFDPRGMIGGRRVLPEGEAKAPYYRYNLVEKQTYFSAYHIAPHTVEDYVNGMRRHGVQYMNGYAMGNYFLAQMIEKQGIAAPQLKAVLTSSEKLSPEMRTVFTRVYGCKTFDAWSGVEACALVSECEYGGLHLSPDVGIVEFLDPDTGKTATPGAPAEVVCTGLLNFDQPLIRYRIGDMMRFSEKSCRCGRHMPLVEEITGRMEDSITGPDGRKMVRFHGIFIGIPAIIEGQVIQHQLAEFQIKLVCSTPLSPADRSLIAARMESQLGPIRLQMDEVDTIPRGPNGKFKAVISLLPS